MISKVHITERTSSIGTGGMFVAILAAFASAAAAEGMSEEMMEK